MESLDESVAADAVNSLPGASLSSIRTRVRMLVSVASANRSSISLAELFVLLPRDAFDSTRALEEFLTGDPTLQQDLVVSRGEIVFKGSEDLARQRQEQNRLTDRRIQSARSFARQLEVLCPWIRLVGISGSMAFGGTREEDDIDFFVVTRTNRVWITLLFAMVLAKIHRLRRPGTPVHCFNRVLDETRCEDAFRTAQDPLFAREALSLQVLDGQPFYHNLLLSAFWMNRFFPLLYQQALTRRNAKDEERSPGGHWLWAIANVFALAGLAPYTRLVNHLRNHRIQGSGDIEDRFRTVIQRGFFAYESVRFEHLKDSYRGAF